MYDGTPFVGDAGPEGGLAALGFFVHRAPPSRAAVLAARTLEVMHVRTDWVGGEVGVSWFFHAVGSGVKIDVTALPTSGRVDVLVDRQEWRLRHGWRDWPGDENVRGEMEADGVAMLVFTAAGFIVFNQAGNNPSTEIIVRHREGDSSEMYASRGSCLDDDRIGIRLLTGLDPSPAASVACRCRVRPPPMASINCDDTPRGHAALPPPWPPHAPLPPALPTPSLPPPPPHAPATATDRLL